MWWPQGFASGGRGSLPTAACVELFLRAIGVRFAQAVSSWVVLEDEGRAWVDVEVLCAGSGSLPGGERRVVALAAALIEDAPVDVVDVVTGVDRTNLHLVLAALAHAAGSHEDFDVVAGSDGRAHLARPGPVVAWPT